MNFVQEKILIFRATTGDEQASRKLIDDYYLTVYRFLYKLCKNKPLAQDLTQETFIKVWTSLYKFKGNCRFRSWIFRISYNIFIDYVRANKIEFVSIEDYIDVVCEDSIIFHKNENDYAKILSIIDTLSPKLKSVIFLHYLNELTFTEIAFILEIPKGTVKSRLNAGLNKLRKQLHREVI